MLVFCTPDILLLTSLTYFFVKDFISFDMSRRPSAHSGDTDRTPDKKGLTLPVNIDDARANTADSQSPALAMFLPSCFSDPATSAFILNPSSLQIKFTLASSADLSAPSEITLLR